MPIRFHERQSCPRWVYALIILPSWIPLGITLGLHDRTHLYVPLIISIVIPSLFLLVFGVMDTELREDHLYITFGITRWITYRFKYTEIVDLKTRTYSPLGDYGGWGIKGWDNHRALNARGDRGVELTIRREGNKQPLYMMIGSQKPEELEAALRAVVPNADGQLVP